MTNTDAVNVGLFHISPVGIIIVAVVFFGVLFLLKQR